MAEVFGAMVSGISLLSLSAELLDGARRVKGFFERTKDAPALLEDLAFELETISLLLLDLEKHRQQESHDTLLVERCITRCAKKAKFIRQQIDVLDERTQKYSRLGKVSVAFKHNELRSLLKDLERWKSSILVAFASCQTKHNIEQARAIRAIDNTLTIHGTQIEDIQATSNAQLDLSLRAQSLDLIARPLSGGTECTPLSSYSITPPEPHSQGFIEPEDEQEAHPVRKRNRRAPLRTSRSTAKFRGHLSFPTWLTRCVWEFAAMQSHGGWTVSMKTYNLVPRDSPIRRFCRAGDLLQVRDLITRGEASVSDRDEYGEGPLEWATLSGNIELCRFLLGIYDDGLPGNLQQIFHRCAFDASLMFGTSDTVIEQIYRLFIEEFNADVDLHDFAPVSSAEGSEAMGLFEVANLNCAEIIRRNQTVPYGSIPEQQRFEIARFLSLTTINDSPGFILRWAGLEEVTPRFATFKDNNYGDTVLYRAIRRLGQCISEDGCGRDAAGCRYSPRTQGWITFIIELLKKGADPLSFGRKGCTPFATMLEVARLCSWNRSLEQSARCLVECTQTWAQVIMESGNDLGAYANQECNIWSCYNESSRMLFLRCIIESPVFDQEPSKCSVKLRWRSTLPVYRLSNPPGAWCEIERRPSTILWYPSTEEATTGIWRQESLIYVKSSEAIDARAYVEDWNDKHHHELDATEDDCGIIALRVNRRRHLAERRRSCSEPPPLRRTMSEGRECWVYGTRPWLPHCHICPYGMELRFDCVGHHDGETPSSADMSLRECLRGVSVSKICVQETWQWRVYSWQGELNRR